MPAEETNKRFKIEPLLGGVALLLLLIGCFFILQPFMTALMWAMILAYSLHPMQRKFTKWFRGSRTLAAIFVTLTITVVLAGPVVLIGLSIAEDGMVLAKTTRKWFMAAPETAPEWVAQAPVVGDDLAGYWSKFAEDRNRWMDQLDKEVKTPPRPKIVVENGEDTVLQDPPPPVENGEPDAVANGEVKKQSPQVLVLFGQFLAWARGWLLDIGVAITKGVTQMLVSAFLAFFLLR